MKRHTQPYPASRVRRGGSCGTNWRRKAFARMAWSSLGKSPKALECSAATRSIQANDGEAIVTGDDGWRSSIA